MDATPRVAVLFDRLGPYHRARLDAAGSRMGITAVELAGKSAEYDWNKVQATSRFQRTTLFSDTDSRSVPVGRMQERVRTTLEDIRPSAVAIPGWSHPGALSALLWCLSSGTPSIVMSASTERDAPRWWWAESIKSRVVRHFGAGLVGGTPHRAYLHQLGVPRERIFLGYDAVDNDHFATGAEQARKNASAVRDCRSLPSHYFLAVGRFVAKKNFLRLLEAFEQYQKETSDDTWDLVLLGDGPKRTDIERCVAEAGLERKVHLPGFKQYEFLPDYYGLAGAFVHASTREQWGLVVNEAMAAELPVLVSARCGCASDLVKEGRNGYTFDPYDPSVLADLMHRVSHGSVNRASMGQVSREVIAQWGPNRFAEGLQNAVAAACERGPSSSSVFDRLLIKALLYR